MCGRYLSLSTPEQLRAHFAVDEVRTEPLPRRYNVAPSTPVYAVIDQGGARRLGTLRWGFVPVWAKALRGTPQPINARLETVASSRMFARSFAHRRCLLPADGFYEWRQGATGKQPYLLEDPAGAPLAFAGIYSAWRDPARADEPPLYSTAIVTTEAVGSLRQIHDRAPVILPPNLWSDWLTASAEEAPHLHGVVTALGVPDLRATAISTRVNDVRNDAPELLEPALS